MYKCDNIHCCVRCHAERQEDMLLEKIVWDLVYLLPARFPGALDVMQL